MRKYSIRPGNIKSIKEAAVLLKTGKLVSFPTETVYGLGGDATNSFAVAAIFKAKKRPSFNPLICHLENTESAIEFAQFSETAKTLASYFWPGPLTLVLPSRSHNSISSLATAGLKTVALRVPENSIARQIIAEARCPIAAPSANRSGRISPTTAAAAAAELGSECPLIIDGGPCRVGLESTIIDLSIGRPSMLRPGGITREEIESKIGPLVTIRQTNSLPSSPGQLASHYAPEKPVRLKAVKALNNETMLGFGQISGDLNLSWNGDLNEAAANFFEYLRTLDNGPGEIIAVAPIPEKGLGIAINDRLRRAAAKR